MESHAIFDCPHHYHRVVCGVTVHQNIRLLLGFSKGMRTKYIKLHAIGDRKMTRTCQASSAACLL